MYKVIVFILIFVLSALFNVVYAAVPANVVGRILLQVEESGKAWYVYPEDHRRYYLGRPHDAFELMRKLGLGAKHDLIVNTDVFPERLAGMILLDVEENGEAYYINPIDLKKYYLGRPADAFRIMREKSLGITNNDLFVITEGDTDEPLIDTISRKVLYDVPFTSQAPYANWNDQRQQDGCEEASVLMTMAWVRAFELDADYALQEILAISDHELEKYGEYRDVSPEDIVDWIFKDYFDYHNIELRKDISIQDMIDELNGGHILIIPADGRLLQNPYFTSPGPERHMLVVVGYDPDTKKFITNDPGTKRGKNFEYNENILWGAIMNYPTGYHEEIKELKKAMIVVSK